MTDEEKAHLNVQLRLLGIHPEWIQHWWKTFPHAMEKIYHEGVDEWWGHSNSHWEYLAQPMPKND